jgi:hypothetical protein
MEYHLGLAMSLYKLTVHPEVLSGLNHCQETWLVLQITMGNFQKSCLHFLAAGRFLE